MNSAGHRDEHAAGSAPMLGTIRVYSARIPEDQLATVGYTNAYAASKHAKQERRR